MISNSIKFNILIFLVTILIQSNIFAQSAGINFTLGFPMNEFKENVSRTGVGGSLHFVLFDPVPVAPFTAGINIGYINYGSESRREPFSMTIPDVTVDVDRTNNITNFHLLFQLMFPTGPVRPYVEGLFGGAYIFTQTSIKSSGQQEVATSTNFDDFAWSYGGGGGFLIHLLSAPGSYERFGSLFLDFKVRYLLGTEAEYLKEGSVTIQNGKAYYEVSRSKTDLLTVHLGVVAFLSIL